MTERIHFVIQRINSVVDMIDWVTETIYFVIRRIDSVVDMIDFSQK